MSGFYNDDLEAEMTGVKPDRPNSGSKNVRLYRNSEIKLSFQLLGHGTQLQLDSEK